MDYECPKCKHYYGAVGGHEDDSGEQTCDACVLTFIVEIEYMPTYSTSCVECEYVLKWFSGGIIENAASTAVGLI